MALGFDFDKGVNWKRKNGWFLVFTLVVGIYAALTCFLPININIKENDANPLQVGGGAREVSGDMKIQLRSGKIWMKPATLPKSSTIKISYKDFQNKDNDATATEDNDYFGDFLPKKAAGDNYMWNGVHDCRKGASNDKDKEVDTNLYVNGNRLSWATFGLVIGFFLCVLIEAMIEDDTTVMILMFIEFLAGIALLIVAGYTYWYQSRSVNCIVYTYDDSSNWADDADQPKKPLARVGMLIVHFVAGLLVVVRSAVLGFSANDSSV